MDEERDYESEARQEGWRPKEEWNGDETKWVDAESFVKKGENILPIVRKKLKSVEARLEQVSETARKHDEWTKKAIQKEREKNKEMLAELEVARAQAITDGDGQEFTRTDREIQRLRESDGPDPTVDEYNKIANKWASENEWYMKDQDLHIYADGLADIIANEGYTGQAYFNELTRRVKESHPDKFENKARKKPNGVDEGGSKSTSEAKPKSYGALPKDAQAACDAFVRDIPGYKREDYLATYDWE
jgi:hypothetical protein